MLKSKLLSTMTLMISLIMVSPTHADLIGVQQGSPTVTSNVYRIDTTTGAWTLIGNSGILSLNSLALTPDGTYYATGGITGSQQLVTIDPNTGAATVIAPITTAVGLTFIAGLAAGTDGTLYGAMVPSGATNSSLYTINRTTGVATVVGSTNAVSIQALDWNDANGTLYGFNGNGTQAARGLRTIDTATGNSTLIGPAGGSSINMQTIAFLPDGTLWGAGSGTGQLYTIDPLTGVATQKFVGVQPVIPSLRGIEYLAPVPVPAAIWLFGSGLAAMVGLARRKMSI